MAINLISLVSQYLTPRMIGPLARMVGVNEVVAQKLVTAAIPVILAALGTTAATTAGAQKVSDAVSNSDPDILTKLGNAVHTGNLQPFTDGANMLSGLLGGSGLSSLAGALSQYSGASQGAAQSLIGAVSQTVLGTLGQQDPSNWSDASSIASLFASQKGAISAALPGELSKALGASGLLAGLGAAAQAASATVSSASSAASTAASAVNRIEAPAASSGFPTWAIVLLALIILAAIYWFLTQNRTQEPPKQGTLKPPGATEYALRALPRPMI